MSVRRVEASDPPGDAGPPNEAISPDKTGRPPGSTEANVPPVEELLDLAVTALGGRRRDGQRTMVRAVADAIDSGEHLLVQAGTGTGKSLGYLVPAVRHAVLTGERVVISTATLALQRQVMARDLPLVASAVAPRLPRPPQIALLKGWHNYLCRHRIAGGYPEEEPAGLFSAADGRGAAEHPRPDAGHASFRRRHGHVPGFD